MKMALRMLLFCAAVGISVQGFNLLAPPAPVFEAQSFNLPIPSPVPGVNLPIPSPVPGVNLPIPSPVPGVNLPIPSPVPGANLS